jgi:hypothetical protein
MLTINPTYDHGIPQTQSQGILSPQPYRNRFSQADVNSPLAGLREGARR